MRAQVVGLARRTAALVGPAALLAVVLLNGRAWSRLRASADRIRAERPTAAPILARHPRVSMLVAAWNDAPGIAGHVASVRALRYPNLQYILCAGGSDGTFEVARDALGEWGQLLRQEPGEGKQRALRRCLPLATGEIVYLTDSDCVIDDASLARVLEPIVAGAAAASGRSRPAVDQITRQPEVLCQWAPHYVSETTLGDTSPGLLGRNCAVERGALRRAGDFAADVATGTDYHLARELDRTGARIAFARWSFVETRMPASVAAYVRQQSRWLRNHWVHGRRTGDRAALVHAVRTWALGVALAALPALALVAGPIAVWAWLALALHGALARARYVAFVARAEALPLPGRALVSSPLWFAIDAFSWVRSLIDVLVPSRRGRW